MSGSSTQRVRKSSPCSSSKQGPMRATLPMSSLLRQGSSLRKSKSNSPTLSPTSPWRTRISPESSLSGQRSPGSLNYKAKSKTLNARSGQSFGGSCAIRRTASLDTIYLNGQWPRESFYTYCGRLLVDKATQTDDFPNEQRKPYRHPELSAADDAKLEKIMRHRLQRVNKEGGSSRERTAAFNLILQPNMLHGDAGPSLPSTGTNTTDALPLNIPLKPLGPRPPMRSSIEGLNQEIETLVLKSGSGNGDTGREEEKTYCQATPEGHRAPLADLLRSTRSVNTQTPAGQELTGSSQSSGSPSRESVSPPMPSTQDSSRPPSDLQNSPGSTPDQETGKLGTSPHINKFLAREPPDGCEKISSKFVEDSRRPIVDVSKFDFCPLKPCMTLRPSQGSAFYPLTHAARSEAGASFNGEVSRTDSTESEEPASSPSVPMGGGENVPHTPPPLPINHLQDNAGI